MSENRLIVALDVPDIGSAQRLVRLLLPEVRFFKIGLELYAGGQASHLVAWLKEQDCQVMCDLKLFDIPETVRRASLQVAKQGADLLTVHAQTQVMQAALGAVSEVANCSTQIIAVTVLTSTEPEHHLAYGVGASIADTVRARSKLACDIGCAGVVCSALELQQLRQFNQTCLAVVPGIRASGSQDDQFRVATAKHAMVAGASHLVVGRPIRDAKDPKGAALEILQQIAEVDENRN